MKPITAWFLIAALVLGLTGCGAPSTPTEPAQAEPTLASAEPAPAPTDPTVFTESTVPATQPEEETGFLFLTVSRLTFTLAGETEDVYTGTIPREKVTFGTADPGVATFENGVLTAVGPGETTAFAEYGDRRLECTVGCLAENEEALAQVDPAILRTAKRFPPLADDTYLSYFDDAAIIGDSITYVMWQWQNKYKDLGNALFLCQGGSSINGYILKVSYVYYQGQKMSLEDALAACGRGKAFIMLGQNDLSYLSLEETMERWVTFLEMIREKNPDLEIYLQSCIPEWGEIGDDNSKNELIVEHNTRLKAFAEENGCHFLELYPYAVDHTGRMPAEYNLDNLIHMSEPGCRMWMQLLRSYAEYEILKGEAQ